MTLRSRGALVILVCMLLGTTGCANASASPADKTFVADMTPHHALGVRMAAVALLQADDVRVREFGFTMGRYQKAEFAQLSQLADSWHAHASTHIHGMLTPAEEQALASTSGPTFDVAWLQQMIRHHEGAVAMATHETALGSNAKAKAIAASVAQVQTKEIAQMKAVLAELQAK